MDQKCTTCSNVCPNSAFKKKSAGQYKTCLKCREKARLSKANLARRRANVANATVEKIEPLLDGPVTRTGNRSVVAKKHSDHLYKGRCVISGIQGPGVVLAHIIPVKENDTWQNIIPLRADLHNEFDGSSNPSAAPGLPSHPLWAFDPRTITKSTRKGFISCAIIHSDKGVCDHCSVREFTGTYYIREESMEFIEEAYKRFIKSEFPEEISDGTVPPPTVPYVSK